MIGFNKQWAQSKTEAQFVAEFKGMQHIGMTEAELKEAYYQVTGKPKPEVKPAPKPENKG